MNTIGSESEGMERAALESSTSDKKHEAPKRAYTRKDNKRAVPTFASVSDLIEAKKQEIEKIQAEIEVLITQRNELFFLESQEIGLINIVSDPNRAKWLADMVKESAYMKR